MTVFVDTSALYTLLDRADPRHSDVRAAHARLAGQPLLTHSYVVLETVALVERRLSRATCRRLLLDILAPVDVVYVDESIHLSVASSFIASSARGPSFVDLTSFEVMLSHGIRRVLALDRHFSDAGFELVV